MAEDVRRLAREQYKSMTDVAVNPQTVEDAKLNPIYDVRMFWPPEITMTNKLWKETLQEATRRIAVYIHKRGLPFDWFMFSIYARMEGDTGHTMVIARVVLANIDELCP